MVGANCLGTNHSQIYAGQILSRPDGRVGKKGGETDTMGHCAQLYIIDNIDVV